jgi:hypothetical protein
MERVVMTKPVCAHWYLQRKVDEIIGRLAPGCFITPEICHQTETTTWDEDCPSVGRMSWEVLFHLPPDNPSVEALLPILNKEIEHLQRRYDLGVTNEITLAAA